MFRCYFSSWLHYINRVVKNRSVSDGAWLPISGSSFITCPLKALNLYADMAGIDFESDLPLFRGLNSVKAKTRIRSPRLVTPELGN